MAVSAFRVGVTVTLSRSDPSGTASRGGASGSDRGPRPGTRRALPFVGAGDALRAFTCCEGRFSQVPLRREDESSHRGDSTVRVTGAQAPAGGARGHRVAAAER